MRQRSKYRAVQAAAARQAAMIIMMTLMKKITVIIMTIATIPIVTTTGEIITTQAEAMTDQTAEEIPPLFFCSHGRGIVGIISQARQKTDTDSRLAASASHYFFNRRHP